jgi:type IV secretory pathway VirB4 component
MLKARATQEFVPIKEVRDGTIILKNGELRAIILANSINLSLKSEDEQKATILQFQNFLNTLDFPVQISIQSRRLDIRPYLLTLEEKMKVQTEPLLKLQTKEYIDFIKNFTDSVSIMTKSFFVVIPYTHTILKSDTNILGNLFSRKSKAEERLAKEEDFEEKKSQLEERVGVRMSRIGTWLLGGVASRDAAPRAGRLSQSHATSGKGPVSAEFPSLSA